jgi:conjugative relaxase-like TrwC/TraI family protein
MSVSLLAALGRDIPFLPAAGHGPPGRDGAHPGGVDGQGAGQVIAAAHDAAVADTVAYLERRAAWARRGAAHRRVPVNGLIAGAFRHHESASGDPCPHAHVLLANGVEMGDAGGGWKAADTVLWREELHAATMVGRVAAARAAVEAGFAIEADPGPSGRLRHWRIAGIPDEVVAVHSKRSAEIDAHLDSTGFGSPRARAVAARETRKAKRFEGPTS